MREELIEKIYSTRQWLINVFDNRISSTLSEVLPSTNDDDDFDGTLTLEPQSSYSPIKLTQGEGVRILAPKIIIAEITYTAPTNKSW